MKKKLIIFLFIVNFCLLTNAQFFNPYVQIAGGVAVDNDKMRSVSAEFGTTYKWLDIALAYEYASNSMGKDYFGDIYLFKDKDRNPFRSTHETFGFHSVASYQLVAKVDVVRLFVADSRHSFKIGGGFGTERESKWLSTYNFPPASEVEYYLKTESHFGPSSSLKAAYEYRVTPKFSLGTYFGGTYYLCVGLLLRGNF